MSQPLVFVPDMMCDARVFFPQLSVISRDRIVIVAPFHEAETIHDAARDLLDRLPAEFNLAGLGMGSAVAMEMLRQASERVTRIALISAQAQAEGAAEAARLEDYIVQARAGRISDAVFGALGLEHLAAGPSRVVVQEQIQEMALEFGAQSFVRQIKALQRRPDQQRTLRTARIRAAIIYGEHQPKYTVRHHQILADLMPDASLKVIAGAAHFPTLESPDQTTAALQEWLGAPLLLG